MKRMRKAQKAIAITLCITVWHFCVVAAYARELGVGASDAQDFSLGTLKPQPGTRSPRPAQPLAVSGSAGQVFWKSLPGPSPFWICRTGTGAGVSLDVKGNGAISILEESNIDLQAIGNELLVSILRGSVQLEGPAGASVRVRTFDGTYFLGESAFKSRFSWRAGRLSVDGEAGRRLSDSSEMALQVLPESDRVRMPNGKPGKMSVRVVDVLGEPVQGAPVVFSAREGARVSFSGSASAAVLTDESGVAATPATVFSGGAPATVAATVAGTSASAAVQADVDRTTGGQKMMAWIVMGALAAATVVLVIMIKDEDDPEMTTGGPTRIAP